MGSFDANAFAGKLCAVVGARCIEIAIAVGVGGAEIKGENGDARIGPITGIGARSAGADRFGGRAAVAFGFFIGVGAIGGDGQGAVIAFKGHGGFALGEGMRDAAEINLGEAQHIAVHIGIVGDHIAGDAEFGLGYGICVGHGNGIIVDRRYRDVGGLRNAQRSIGDIVFYRHLAIEILRRRIGVSTVCVGSSQIAGAAIDH